MILDVCIDIETNSSGLLRPRKVNFLLIKNQRKFRALMIVPVRTKRDGTKEDRSILFEKTGSRKRYFVNPDKLC